MALVVAFQTVVRSLKVVGCAEIRTDWVQETLDRQLNVASVGVGQFRNTVRLHSDHSKSQLANLAATARMAFCIVPSKRKLSVP
jgi:hypothetical protein